MNADPAPEVPSSWKPKDPGRPATAPAWEAAWKLLSDGKPYPRTEVIAAMRKASPISWRTARDVLILGTRNGTLTVTDRDSFGRPTLKRSDR